MSKQDRDDNIVFRYLTGRDATESDRADNYSAIRSIDREHYLKKIPRDADKMSWTEIYESMDN